MFPCQRVLNGLTIGCVYALVALGLTLVYGILRVPNFSHGALYTIGAYATFLLIGRFGAGFWPALLGALHLVLNHSWTGSKIVASAQNRTGSALVGIDAGRVSMLTFALSGGLAAVAAVLFAPIALLSPAMGELVITEAFVIVALGGLSASWRRPSWGRCRPWG